MWDGMEINSKGGTEWEINTMYTVGWNGKLGSSMHSKDPHTGRQLPNKV